MNKPAGSMAELLKNRRFRALAVGGVGVVAVIGFFMRRPAPPTAEEFFARNPHLTRATERVSPEPGPARSDDAFLPDDYHLVGGKAFPIVVKQELSMRGAGKVLFESGYEARIVLHSFGMRDRQVSFIAEYHFDKFRGDVKLTPNIQAQLGVRDFAKKEENLFRVRMDPAGRVSEMALANPVQDEMSLEMKVNSLLALFRRLPPLQPGTLTKNEGDDRGIPFPILYTISDAGNRLLKISGEAKVGERLASSPSKAAATGAPDLSLVGLEEDQTQSFEWTWDRNAGLPRTQTFRAEARMRQFGNELSSTLARVSAEWQPPKAARFTVADEARFKTLVDFRRFASMSGDRLRNLRKFSKKDALGRAWADVNDLATLLRDPGMTDSQKDQLFVDYARALRDDPSHIGQVKDLAMHSAPGSREVSMALGALGFEGSPEAQAAMIDIYRRENATPDERQKVLTEFALSPGALTAETKDFLTGVYREASPLVSELAGSAGLALGASISKDGDSGTVKMLQTEWDRSTGLLADRANKENMQVYLLTAMGNSKSDVFLPEAKTSLGSANEDVRSAAVNSLRFAQDEASRELLTKAIDSDPSTDVKMAAARSLRYQPFDQRTYQALDRCAGQSDLGVKLECYRVLTSRIEQPGVREMLTSRLASERDEQVRGLLSNALTVEPAKNGP